MRKIRRIFRHNLANRAHNNFNFVFHFIWRCLVFLGKMKRYFWALANTGRASDISPLISCGHNPQMNKHFHTNFRFDWFYTHISINNSNNKLRCWLSILCCICFMEMSTTIYCVKICDYVFSCFKRYLTSY